VSTRTSRAAATLATALFATGLLGAVAGCREADPYFRYGVLPDAAAAIVDAGATGPDASESCPACPVSVLYTCRDSAGTSPSRGNDQLTASFILDVTNQADPDRSPPASIALAALTLRYWFTRDQHPAALDCDTAKVGCTNVTTKVEAVLPPRPGANAYVEIAFTRGALSLDPGLDTGDIQLHLYATDQALIDPRDDYSSLCNPVGVAFPSNRITAYLDGVLVWGLEPPR
jgi:hypothetical protein